MSILARHGIFQPVRSQGVYCSDNVSSEKYGVFTEQYQSLLEVQPERRGLVLLGCITHLHNNPRPMTFALVAPSWEGFLYTLRDYLCLVLNVFL